jgi:hypothetical protein
MGQNFFGIIDRESKTIEPFRDEENVLHLNDEYELKAKRFNSFRLTIDNTKKVLTHSYWPIHWIGVNI